MLHSLVDSDEWQLTSDVRETELVTHSSRVTGNMFGIPLHRLVIHFPIALAVVALIYDAWAMYSRNGRLHATGSSLSILAAASAAIATVTGLDLAGVSGLGSSDAVTGHAGTGILGTIILSVFALMRYSAEARAEEPGEAYTSLWFAAQLAAALCIAAAAVIGHRIADG